MTVNVMTDGGSENVSLGGGGLPGIAEHVIAQVGIHFSNSMVEAFWRQLRHQWLHLHSLESVASIRDLVRKHVADHNALIQRVELGGRTPDDARAGLQVDLEARLQSAYAAALKARFAANRMRSCVACAPPLQLSGALHDMIAEPALASVPGSRAAATLRNGEVLSRSRAVTRSAAFREARALRAQHDRNLRRQLLSPSTTIFVVS